MDTFKYWTQKISSGSLMHDFLLNWYFGTLKHQNDSGLKTPIGWDHASINYVHICFDMVVYGIVLR